MLRPLTHSGKEGTINLSYPAIPEPLSGPGGRPESGAHKEAVMAKKVKRSVAPIYAVAAVWLVFGLFLPLYRPIHYVAAALT